MGGRGSEVYSSAAEEGRIRFISSTSEGTGRLLSPDSPPAALFEFEESLRAEMKLRPCEIVGVRSLTMPEVPLSMPLAKGEGSKDPLLEES